MKKGQYNTMEAHLLTNGKPGYEFFTVKSNNNLTAMATYFGKRITTELVQVIGGGAKTPTVEQWTKVTILGDRPKALPKQEPLAVQQLQVREIEEAKPKPIDLTEIEIDI